MSLPLYTRKNSTRDHSVGGWMDPEPVWIVWRRQSVISNRNRTKIPRPSNA